MATGDIIAFQIMSAAALPNGGNIDGNGVIARIRLEGLAGNIGGAYDLSKLTGTGASPGWNRAKAYSATNTARAVTNSMLTILINPAKLGTQNAMETEALAFVEWLRAAPAAPGFEAVQMAGEPERAARLQRARDGIAIDPETWLELRQAGDKVGVTLPE